MDKALQGLKRQTTTQSVIEALQNYMVSNEFKSGDKLPSEQTLCKHLNVSRIAIRESMQHFKSLEIIDSKPKSGSVVNKFIPDNPYKHYMPYMDNHSAVLKELAQMRTIMDFGLSMELCDIIKPGHVDQLKNINDKVKDSDEKTRSLLDAEFHSYMINITGNRILMGLKPLLIDFFRESRMKRIFSNYTATSSKQVYDEHKAIINALENRDKQKLFEAIINHSNRYREFSNS